MLLVHENNKINFNFILHFNLFINIHELCVKDYMILIMKYIQKFGEY